MNEIDPFEVSALIDGELTPQRAAEVRRAMEGDPALKAEYERIVELDQRCRRAGEAAAFRPRIELLPQRRGASSWTMALAVAVLLVVHLLPKVTEAFAAGVAINVAALAALVLGLSIYGRALSATPGRWLHAAGQGSES